MVDGRALLAEAEELEAHEPALAALTMDLEWMRCALAVLRGLECAPLGARGELLPSARSPVSTAARRDLARLVAAKYGLCAAGAMVASALALPFLAASAFAPWFALVLAPVGFYLVEAQLVFLVPLAIDGEARPWRASIGWTTAAGGAVRVLATVLPIAGFMLAGLFVRRGAARSWRVGCLAVLLWYEHVRRERRERIRHERPVSA